MRTFKFKIENYTNSPHFILIKGENSFKAMNIARQMFPIDKYKITFIDNENNSQFSSNIR